MDAAKLKAAITYNAASDYFDDGSLAFWDRYGRRTVERLGIGEADIVAEEGHQPLRSPDDWWNIVLGSGYRWTVEQMDNDAAAQVRKASLKTLWELGATAIETNVIYAVATTT
jgi:hypothetical protein